MSAFTDFETETAVADWPLEDDTGVGGMDDGFCQDETIAFGIADRPMLRGELS